MKKGIFYEWVTAALMAVMTLNGYAREQAAVILDRTAKILEITPTGTAATFSDRSEFSSWSAESIGRVSAILCSEQATPLMQGSNGKFMPGSSYTVEQSVLTLVRMMQAE